MKPLNAKLSPTKKASDNMVKSPESTVRQRRKNLIKEIRNDRAQEKIKIVARRKAINSKPFNPDGNVN